MNRARNALFAPGELHLFPLAVPWLVLLALLACLPNLGLQTHLHPFDVKRTGEVGFLALSMALILLPPVARAAAAVLDHLASWARLGLGIVALLGMVSALSAEQVSAAMQEWATLVGLGLCVLMLAAGYRGHRNRLRTGLALTVLISSGWYLLQFLVGLLAAVMEHLAPQWPLPLFGFANVRFFAHYQLALLPLLAWTVAHFRHPALRIVASILFVLWCSLLWYALGRGAPLALAIAMLVTGLVLRRRGLRFLGLMTAGLTAGLLLAWLFLQFPQWIGATAPPPADHVMSTEDPARLFLWQQALELIAAHPLLGIGPMQYAAVPNPVAAHPHNALLQIGAEWGLPVLFIVLGLAGIGLWHWFRLLTQESGSRVDPLHLAITLALLSLAALSLVSGVLVMPLSQLLLTLLLSLALGEWLSTHEATQPANCSPATPRKLHMLMIMALGAASLAIHALVTWPQIAYRLDHVDYVRERPRAVQGPRFWALGGLPPSH